MAPSRPHQRHDPDAAIRQTDVDASQSRLSAVRKGYLKDPFASYFVPQPHLAPSRSPLINTGTYVRSQALDELILNWISKATTDGRKVQIVSLGAGSDTRFWRIASGCLGENTLMALSRYLELDFEENASAKIRIIQANDKLASFLGKINATGCSLMSSIYGIHSVDLRRFQTVFHDLVTRPISTDDPTSRPVLDATLPTLVLAECVLVYMEPEHSDEVIKWFANTVEDVSFIIYEMYGLTDSFGKIMKENLRMRKVTLPGVDAYPTLKSQGERFTNNGFEKADALSVKTIYKEYIRRIARIEFLDEIEELELVLDHYLIAWATKGFPKGWCSTLKNGVVD